MAMHFINGRAAPVVTAALLLCAQPARAQSASFLTTVGTDTVAIEQYIRTGNTITGMWIQHQSHNVFAHNYALVLGADGYPTHFTFSLYTSRPHTYLMNITYDGDSATRVVVTDSKAVTQRIAMKHAYPALFGSMAGWELALARARSTRSDSTSAIVDRGSPQAPFEAVPVRFVGADSVRIGTAGAGRVDRDGRLLALRMGPQDVKRVPAFDLAKVVAAFEAADAAARAVDSAAIANRVVISLPAEALDRFVGEYALGPNTTLVVARDGEKLTARVGQQQVLELVAVSANTFYPKAANTKFEFQTDSSGNVTALVLYAGGTPQSAARVKR